MKCECGNITDNKICRNCGLVLDETPDLVLHEFDRDLFPNGNLPMKTHEVFKRPEDTYPNITFIGNIVNGVVKDFQYHTVKNQQKYLRLSHFILNEYKYDNKHHNRHYIAEINNICRQLNITGNIQRSIVVMFKKRILDFKTKTHLWLLYCVYTKIREYKVPINTTEIIECVNQYHRSISSKNFLQFIRNFKLKYYGIDFNVYWHSCVNKFCNFITPVFNFDNKVKQKLLSISIPFIPKIKKIPRSDKMKAAVLMYNSILYLRKNDKLYIPISQNQIADFFNVTDISIRSNLKLIQRCS